MLYTTLTKVDFVHLFNEYNRSDNFTIEGRVALYEYYNDLSDELGEDIETDIIAICCEWTEFKNFADAKKDLGFDADTIDELIQHTNVIEFDGGILVQEF